MRKTLFRRVVPSLLVPLFPALGCSAGAGLASPTSAEANADSRTVPAGAESFEHAARATDISSDLLKPIPIPGPIHPIPIIFPSPAILQGLGDYSLVAGKTFAARGYFADQATADSVDHVTITVTRPDGGKASLTSSTLARLPSTGRGGPSVAATAPGTMVYEVGTYFIQSTFYDVNGGVVGTVNSDDLAFQPTKDVRVLVDRIWSGTAAAKPHEIQSAIDAVTRMAQVMPVRDGVSVIGGGHTTGIRYALIDNPQPTDSGFTADFANAKNPPPGTEPCDVAMTWRFANPGEGYGANERPTPLSGLPWAAIVWGDPDHPDIAESFTHETGHAFGLEAPTSPYTDGVHSTEQTIQGGDELLGFNVGYDQAYASPLHDLMYYSGDETNDAFAMNTYDWEYERERIMLLPSSGPTPADVLGAKLAGTDLQGATAIGVNADGRHEFYAVGGDGALYHRWETQVGGYATGALSGWASLDAYGTPGTLRVARQADGRITLFLQAANRQIYFVAQNGPNGGWPTSWQPLAAMTTRGFDVGTNQDGRLEVQAVGDDGALHTIWQVTPNGAFSAPASLGGTGLAGPVAIGRNADGRLQSFAIGGDANVYSLWEPAPDTGPWSAWTTVSDSGMTNARALHVVATPDGRLSLVALRNDGSFVVRTQATASGSFAPSVSLGGTFSTATGFALTSTNDGRLHVLAVQSDGTLWQDFQVDAARPAVWSSWLQPSGHTFKGGIAAASYETTGSLEVVGVETTGVMDWGVF
jgi:hypothetical protein